MTEQAKPGLIYQQIPKLIAEVGAIGKDRKNTQQGFNYRGVDDVFNSVHPLFARHKVFMTPEVLSEVREEKESKTGGKLFVSRLTIRYTLFAEDGSSVVCVTVGEGMDSGDKATSKAQSIAYKYCLFQLLCIPTEELVDPDAESHQVAAGNKQLETLEKALAAIDKAQTVDALATLVEKVEKRISDGELPAFAGPLFHRLATARGPELAVLDKWLTDKADIEADCMTRGMEGAALKKLLATAEKTDPAKRPAYVRECINKWEAAKSTKEAATA